MTWAEPASAPDDMNDRTKYNLGRAELPGSDPSADTPELLARRTHRLLRQIPGRHAPSTLAPRVLAELARRAQLAWYRRPWTDWPEVLRWFSTLLLAGVVAGVLRLVEGGWASSKASPTLTAVETVPVFLEAAETSGRALIGIIDAVPLTWWLVGGSGLLAITTGALGLGTAAWRIARSSNH